MRTPREIVALKELLRSANSEAYVIAKIEKREALDNLEEVVKASDGVMVCHTVPAVSALHYHGTTPSIH